MTTYARIDPLTGLVRDTVDITQQQFDALAGNPKRAFIKPLVFDAEPVPAAGQAVVSAGYVIEANQVRQTWALRAKSQPELDRDAEIAELTVLRAVRTALQNDIAAGITAAPTTAAQAFVEIQDLKRRALRADRAILWLINQQR